MSGALKTVEEALEFCKVIAVVLEEFISNIPQISQSWHLHRQLVLVVVIGYLQATALKRNFLASQQPCFALSVAGLLGFAAQFPPDDVPVAGNFFFSAADRSHRTLQLIPLNLSPQLLVLLLQLRIQPP
jgi:hypothetical protein